MKSLTLHHRRVTHNKNKLLHCYHQCCQGSVNLSQSCKTKCENLHFFFFFHSSFSLMHNLKTTLYKHKKCFSYSMTGVQLEMFPFWLSYNCSYDPKHISQSFSNIYAVLYTFQVWLRLHEVYQAHSKQIKPGKARKCVVLLAPNYTRRKKVSVKLNLT